VYNSTVRPFLSVSAMLECYSAIGGMFVCLTHVVLSQNLWS